MIWSIKLLKDVKREIHVCQGNDVLYENKLKLEFNTKRGLQFDVVDYKLCTFEVQGWKLHIFDDWGPMLKFNRQICAILVLEHFGPQS